METVLHWVTQYGYIGIFSLLVLGIVGLPVPDEWLLTFAGYLVYRGDLRLLPTMTAAFLGSGCGITLSYGLGRTIGLYLIEKYGRFVHITGEEVDRVQHWFDRVGKWGLLLGYFVPGVRHLTALVAGSSRLRPSVFASFAYTGALIWSVTFVSVGYLLGEQWAWVLERLHRRLAIGSALIIALLLVFLAREWRRKTR